MKRTDLKKHAAALLLVLCLLVTSALPALATSANIKLVDSSGNPTTGTIRVTLYDSANDKALSGGKLTLYRVAEVKRQNGNLSYEYCGDFYGCGIALGDLTDSTLAAQLQEYLPQSAEGTTKTIDADGNVTFRGLELGLYLIVQTEASKGYEPINPFLVSLPMAEDGKWNYAVDASPKVGAYTPAKPDTPPTPLPRLRRLRRRIRPIILIRLPRRTTRITRSFPVIRSLPVIRTIPWLRATRAIRQHPVIQTAPFCRATRITRQ